MVSPRRTVLIICTLAIVALATALFVATRNHPEPYENLPQLLPDGSILTLVRVDYGKTNELIEGTRFQKMFRRFIPKGGTNFLGYKIQAPTILGTSRSVQDKLVFWVKRTVLPGAPAPTTSKPQYSLPWQIDWSVNTYAVAFDENGNEYQNRAGSPNSGATTNQYFPIDIPAFPREGKMVGIRIFKRPESSSSDWKKVAEFKTANPSPGPHPHWNPAPLPDTHKIDNLEFSLTGLKVIPPIATQSRFHMSKYWTVPEFRVAEDGKANTDWAPVTAWIYEANGNYHGPTPVSAHSPSGILIEDSLNPAEPWKLHVEFYRNKDFAPQELWTVTNLSLATATIKTNIQGTPVTIGVSSGRILQVNLPARPKGLRVSIISAVDSASRASILTQSTSLSSNTQIVLINPTAPAPQSLDVTVAVTKSVLVDFLARPTMSSDK